MRKRYRYRRRNYQLSLVKMAFVLITVLFFLFLGGRWLTEEITEFFQPDLVDAQVTAIGDIPLYTDFLPVGYAGRTEQKRKIKWIVIHETGNPAAGTNAAMHNRFLHSPEQKEVSLSWHYTVDDREIYHHLPDDEWGYHASDSAVKDGGNACGIGIEICVNEDGNYEQAVDNTAQLVAFLLQRYRLSLEDVKQHGDFTNKNCPERLRDGDGYTEFLAKIQQYMEDEENK